MTINITLNQIKKVFPSTTLTWKSIRSQYKNVEGDTSFPLNEILESQGVFDTVKIFGVLPEYFNVLEKYVVWNVAQIKHLVKDPKLIALVDAIVHCTMADVEYDFKQKNDDECFPIINNAMIFLKLKHVDAAVYVVSNTLYVLEKNVDIFSESIIRDEQISELRKLLQ